MENSSKKKTSKKKAFAQTGLPILILIGSVCGTLIYVNNPRIWSDIFSPAPTLENLTGTWKSSLSGRGLAIWLPSTTDKWYYDIVLELTQTGNTITGQITETLYNAPIGWSKEPIIASITDGSVNGINVRFNVGDVQWTGTFLSWSMKGVVQEQVDTTPHNGIQQVGPGWVGTFNLQRV